MESQEPWLVCRKSGKTYLLAKGEGGYYGIEVGKRLDYATEEWLQQQGVTEELLKELHLTYQSYPKADIRGVAIGGTLAGDRIYLYPKSGNRQEYLLELDYEDAFVEDFFAGISRFQLPKKKEPKGNGDWRKAKQDPQLFDRLRFVPAVCLIANICAAWGYVSSGHWVWFTVCLLFLIAQLGLVIFMPAYFTIGLPKSAKKQNVWELEFPLLALMCILIFRSEVNLLSDGAFGVTFLIGIGAGFLLYPFLVDLHQEKWGLPCTVLISAIIGMLLIGQCNQVYDFGEKDCYVLEVEDLHSSGGRRGRNYYCGVMLPDGREVSLNITRDFYNSLEVGDLVQVERGDGAFGMEYANASPLKER